MRPKNMNFAFIVKAKKNNYTDEKCKKKEEKQ